MVWSVLVVWFRSRASLEAEILILRHQLNIQRRHLPKRLTFSAIDRLIFAGLYRLVPSTLNALTLVKPETVVRWHRAGFRSYWRWKSRPRSGRPTVPAEIRRLIREMSVTNPLWGAPRIHGELLKLGIEIGQTSVAKYMASQRGPPSQGWKTFLRNHADGIAAIDLFVVPTISFWLLYGLLIMGHGRRQILWFGVTPHPTAEWIANQLTEACGWQQIPRIQAWQAELSREIGVSDRSMRRWAAGTDEIPEGVWRDVHWHAEARWLPIKYFDDEIVAKLGKSEELRPIPTKPLRAFLGLHFALQTNKGRTVRCFIDREVFDDRVPREPLALTLEYFRRHAEIFYQAAQRKYNDGDIYENLITISNADVVGEILPDVRSGSANT